MSVGDTALLNVAFPADSVLGPTRCCQVRLSSVLASCSALLSHIRVRLALSEGLSLTEV